MDRSAAGCRTAQVFITLSLQHMRLCKPFSVPEVMSLTLTGSCLFIECLDVPYARCIVCKNSSDMWLIKNSHVTKMFTLLEALPIFFAPL